MCFSGNSTVLSKAYVALQSLFMLERATSGNFIVYDITVSRMYVLLQMFLLKINFIMLSLSVRSEKCRRLKKSSIVSG